MQWWVGHRFPAAACDLAIVNGGSLRANISAGLVSFASIQTALPFPNSLASLQLQGSTLVSVLQRSLSALGSDNNGLFLQLDGIRIVYNAALPVGLRLLSARVRDATGAYNEIRASQVNCSLLL